MLQSVTKYIYSSTILTYRFEAAEYFHFLLLHTSTPPRFTPMHFFDSYSYFAGSDEIPELIQSNENVLHSMKTYMFMHQ